VFLDVLGGGGDGLADVVGLGFVLGGALFGGGLVVGLDLVYLVCDDTFDGAPCLLGVAFDLLGCAFVGYLVVADGFAYGLLHFAGDFVVLTAYRVSVAVLLGVLL
jgi:hypothetical protein